MRNVAEYPVTAEEIMERLESMPQVNPPGTPPSQLRIGGIGDMVRRGIIEYFEKPENMDAVVKSFSDRYERSRNG